MRKKHFYLLTFLLLLNVVFCKNGNNTKIFKNIHKKINTNSGTQLSDGRDKRSIRDVDNPFINERHALENENLNEFAKYLNTNDERREEDKSFEKEPFWGTRGRRDETSESTEYAGSNDVGYKDSTCKKCSKYFHHILPKQLRDEKIPILSDRGRTYSDEDGNYSPFWGNRGRRQEDPPFWGNRGRRGKFKSKSVDTIEEPPFWSSRGRRDDVEPFWGNRGRRDEIEAFWGNRGRRDETDPFWGNRGRRDEMEPFWGNRGRRQDDEPFWGTRGRRETKTPLWGNYGKEKAYWTTEDTIRGILGRRKFALKENIINAMNNMEYDIEKLARMRRDEETSFWSSRGRDSKLKSLFNGPARNRASYSPNIETGLTPTKSVFRPAEQNTVYDDRIYAEEPHYILIERSSRSSAEDDPFFISRGKKYIIDFKLPTNGRDRRGALEDLVKSVRNDPYYIARGKKNVEYIKIGNSTILKDQFVKAKELICSAIDLLVIKNDGHKVKREVDESERERRTILNKLAAQLQIDPYFVSRGKKNGNLDINDGRLEEFVNHVTDMCD